MPTTGLSSEPSSAKQPTMVSTSPASNAVTYRTNRSLISSRSLRVCRSMAALLRCLRQLLPVDLRLHRRGGLADELVMMRPGVVVALAPPFARTLEMRVHVARHELVMPPGRVPVGPVLRQLHDHAEPAGSLQQVLDERDSVVGCADAGGAAFDKIVDRILDAGRHDRKCRHRVEIVAELRD